ncbi:hypothetical protein [uncultured Cardiobacterium sp.]|uniref:hypothetical protein n=1 Tax=uncultured Cardiobacterium sp. TaxID=417619 RepID=UPI002639183B|nr:hypothetical protein [uncultured Cardiobacterium sp.]
MKKPPDGGFVFSGKRRGFAGDGLLLILVADGGVVGDVRECALRKGSAGSAVFEC